MTQENSLVLSRPSWQAYKDLKRELVEYLTSGPLLKELQAATALMMPEEGRGPKWTADRLPELLEFLPKILPGLNELLSLWTEKLIATGLSDADLGSMSALDVLALRDQAADHFQELWEAEKNFLKSRVAAFSKPSGTAPQSGSPGLANGST